MFYWSNIRPIQQSKDASKCLNSVSQVIHKLDYYGTRFLLLNTDSLEEISFTSNICSETVSYKLKHIGNTTSNKGIKEINTFLFHPKPFPYLERISLQGSILKFPNMLFSSSQKCNNRYEPSQIGFFESLSCLRFLIADHLNFTIEMGDREFFYPTPTLNFHYDFMHN